MTIDTTNLCSHLQKKLFEPEGVYYPIWQAMQNDEELTAVVRSRQLHIYRNGKKKSHSRRQGSAEDYQRGQTERIDKNIKNKAYEFS